MWESNVSVPMHAMHMGLGIGALAVPLISNQFLAILKLEKNPENTSTTMALLNTSRTYVVLKESRVEMAFVTIGILTAVLSFPLFVYSFRKCYNQVRRGDYVHAGGDIDDDYERTDRAPTNLWKMLDPATYSNGARGFGVYVFVVLLMFYFNAIGEQQMFGNFIRSFSVDELQFSRNAASYLDATFWAGFTLGRFVAAILAYFVAVRTVLMIDVLLNTSAAICLVIFTAERHHLLWLFTAAVGFALGPLFPAFVSFTNTQIEVGGIVLTLIMFAGGFGHMFYIWMTGYLYDLHGPKTVLVAMVISSTVVLIITIIYVTSTYKRGERFGKGPPVDTEVLVSGMAMKRMDDQIDSNSLQGNTQ